MAKYLGLWVLGLRFNLLGGIPIESLQYLSILASYIYQLNSIHFYDEILCFYEGNIRLIDHIEIQWEGFQ